MSARPKLRWLVQSGLIGSAPYAAFGDWRHGLGNALKQLWQRDAKRVAQRRQRQQRRVDVASFDLGNTRPLDLSVIRQFDLRLLDGFAVPLEVLSQCKRHRIWQWTGRTFGTPAVLRGGFFHAPKVRSMCLTGKRLKRHSTFTNVSFKAHRFYNAIKENPPMKPNLSTLLGVLALSVCCTSFSQSSNPYADGTAAAPDEWLLVKKGQPWWYETKPSPTPVQLQKRAPTAAEQAIIDRARALVANRPAKAFALMDGDSVLYSEYKVPADADSVFFGFSMGKTVTAMAVGQAICAGKLKLETKANEVMPELNGKALGNATVRDLLRMASGAADPNPDSSVWTPEQFKEWGRGNLNLVNLVTGDRVANAAKGVFSDFKPGEAFSYKSTDPYVLGIMVSRATGTVWNQWIQEKILNPMGAAKSGLYVQDRQQNGLADSGLRMRMEDWMRFGLWVKRSSKEPGCFGDFVRAATATQISNGSSPSTRKIGKQFGGYGYLTWTENPASPDTTWAMGWGGQRISWHKHSDRMVVVFSNVESWMTDVYPLANEWNLIPSPAATSKPVSQTW